MRTELAHCRTEQVRKLSRQIAHRNQCYAASAVVMAIPLISSHGARDGLIMETIDSVIKKQTQKRKKECKYKLKIELKIELNRI